MSKTLKIIFFISCLSSTNTTLSKSKKKTDTCTKDTCKEISELKGPVSGNVQSKNLVTESVKYVDILKHHQSYDQDVLYRHFEGDVLAYVTPWNNHGYDVAKTFGKFTIVSPVWLQLRFRPPNQFVVTGAHDIDKTWIHDVKSMNNLVQILPRLLFEEWSIENYMMLFSSVEMLYKLVDYIVSFIEENGFDGIVLEIWSQFGGNYKSELIGLIKELGEAMMAKKQKLILVIPPPLARMDSLGMFTQEDFDLLAPMVDAFSLMTYDYPSYGKPGPVAPLQWIKECVVALVPEKNSFRQKILLGLNFYGYTYQDRSVAPIVGQTYIELLRKEKPKLKWLHAEGEHRIEFKDKKTKYTLYFPTLKSIESRIAMAKELGTGISIWEIGQGLDYFYDLL